MKAVVHSDALHGISYASRRKKSTIAFISGIGGSAYLAAEIPEVLDKQVSGTILTHLQLVAARVDAAEHARKPADEKIPLGNVPPRLLASQRAAGKPPEVLRFTEGVLSEQLGLYGIEPVGRHRGSSIGLTTAM